MFDAKKSVGIFYITIIAEVIVYLHKHCIGGSECYRKSYYIQQRRETLRTQCYPKIS